MSELFHNQKEARDHYGRVLQTKAPLYYERFDPDILEKRPLVRDLVAGTFAKLIPEKATNLLDVGCGTGFYFPLLTEHAENITGIDVCAPMLEEARQLIEQKGLANCRVCEGSALDLPFEDNTMDVVHSWDFLHHVPDVPKAVSEISRVLRPGGRYVALEPNILNPSIAWYHLRRRSEWRLFLQNQFRIPRLLRGEFDVRVSYDNTIISFLDERTWWLWKSIDRLTSIPPFRLLSFRYVLDCRAKAGVVDAKSIGSERRFRCSEDP
jgi:SAM-dependent methyltransferase